MPPHIVDLNDWQVEQWPTTPEGEECQAREIEEMYRILFSHPLVQAITTWDYKDGAWLKAPSGYLREDNSRKPSYDMLENLVKHEWWTDTTVKTDENGWIEVEAFKGDYQITAGKKKTEVSFADDKEEMIMIR